MKRLSMLSLDQVKKLNDFYCYGGIPEIPRWYEFDNFLTEVCSGTTYLTVGGYPGATSDAFPRDTVVIGIKKKKKYRFVCDNPEQVQVKLHDYILVSQQFVEVDAKFESSGMKAVVFRLEEYE